MRPVLPAAFLAACVAAGCGGADQPPVFTGNGDDSGSSGVARPGGVAASDDAGFLGSGSFGTGDEGGITSSDCTPEATNYIYLIDAANGFYRFDPTAMTVTQVGTLKCPTNATPFSMAVRRDGTAFSVFTDGTLHAFDVSTLACQNLAFTPGQAGFTTFGMGFATDGTSTTETLYVNDDTGTATPTALGRIDLSTLTLTGVGSYSGNVGWAELTGTGDGRLFGAFEGTPYVVAQIDEQSAAFLSQAPQSAISAPPESSSLAFAFWGGVFWLFVGPGTSTDFYKYDPVARTTTLMKTISAEIVGAGVSTCAPVGPLQ